MTCGETRSVSRLSAALRPRRTFPTTSSTGFSCGSLHPLCGGMQDQQRAVEVLASAMLSLVLPTTFRRPCSLAVLQFCSTHKSSLLDEHTKCCWLLFQVLRKMDGPPFTLPARTGAHVQTCFPGCEINNRSLNREEWFALLDCGVVRRSSSDVPFKPRFFSHEPIMRSSRLDVCAAERSSWLQEAG